MLFGSKRNVDEIKLFRRRSENDGALLARKRDVRLFHVASKRRKASLGFPTGNDDFRMETYDKQAYDFFR